MTTQTIEKAIKRMSSNVIVFRYFSVDDILKRKRIPAGRTTNLVKSTGSRKCVSCSVEGVVFIEHRHVNELPYQKHLDLFALIPNGSVRMMTVDHILPKSKGGAGFQSNLQLMCYNCNAKHKKDNVSVEEWDLILSDFSKHVHFSNQNKWKKFVEAYYTDFPELDLTW